MEKCTFDLHHSEYLEGNIMTEYEEKFVAKGNPICMLQVFYNIFSNVHRINQG